MVDKNKKLHVVGGLFTKSELPSAADQIDSIFVEGYASTNDLDRHGDVVPTAVWERGLENYLKNPIILANHDHCEPIGRMVEHKIDNKGLWIRARISAAAEDVFNLVKDGVMTAFSIGFKIVDAEYNSAAEVFVVKELELHEISVVSVPANQNTLFSLSKAFSSAEEFTSYKMQFVTAAATPAKGQGTGASNSIKNNKGWNMDPKELQALLADAANKAAEATAKALEEANAKQKAEREAAEKMQKEIDERVKAALGQIKPAGETGADKLLQEVEKRLQDNEKSFKEVISGLEGALKEKANELEAIQKSRMQFADPSKQGEMSYQDKEKAVLLAKMAGKSLESTKFGRQMVEKYGAHVPSATWELEVSLNMEAELRRKLVVAPLFRNIAMQTNVMTIPVNPEAGAATWVTNAQFGAVPANLGEAGASAGNTATHALKEITLNAYKVATNEYTAYEEEEDALLALMPVIRDGMIRRVARAVDRAFLRGAGAGGDPVKGLVGYDAASAYTLDISNNDKATVAIMRNLRRDIGVWGLDPADVVYIVSQDVYYDLLDDSVFQTMNQVGPSATLLTGQIGQIGNSPVVVSGEFQDKADGAAGAVAVAPANFLVGSQRGLRIDTQELVETQRRVMVASLRTGMIQVTSNYGAGVSALRYVA